MKDLNSSIAYFYKVAGETRDEIINEITEYIKKYGKDNRLSVDACAELDLNVLVCSDKLDCSFTYEYVDALILDSEDRLFVETRNTKKYVAAIFDDGLIDTYDTLRSVDSGDNEDYIVKDGRIINRNI